MKRRNLFMAATILCQLLSIGFTFKMRQITWLWHDSEFAGIILGFLALVFGLQWLKYQKLAKGK